MAGHSDDQKVQMISSYLNLWSSNDPVLLLLPTFKHEKPNVTLKPSHYSQPFFSKEQPEHSQSRHNAPGVLPQLEIFNF